MITASSKTTLVAIASLALGVGCGGDASVESAEEETTTGGEAEASCGGEGSCGAAETARDSVGETTGAEGTDDSSAGDTEASCGEGSCG